MNIEAHSKKHLKCIYKKLTAKIILSGEKKLPAFSLRAVTRQGFPVLPVFNSHRIESPRHNNQKRREIKDIQIGKIEIKLSLLVDDMIHYMENPKDTTKCYSN